MSLTLAAATLIGAGIAAAGGLAGNLINKKTAEENIAYQREANNQNIAFQKQENDITRLREDNAVQRASADMEAAGLSKTLAAGNPASAAALTAPKTQAVNNSFKYESALQKLNLGSLMLDMASKQQQLEINKDVADAQVANINADTVGKGLANDNYLKNMQFEWDYKAAATENMKANAKRVEAETELYKIESEHKADQIMADIGYKISQIDLNYSNVDLNTRKINQISQEIAESVARENKLNEETKKVVEEIIYADLQNKALSHDISYAEKFMLPVGKTPGGVFGQNASAAISFLNFGKGILDGLPSSPSRSTSPEQNRFYVW